MTGSIGHLAWATGAFVGTHLLLSWPPLRRRLVDVLGLWPFRGLYSLVAVVSLVWMVWGFQAAPRLELWFPPIALRHLPAGLMLPAALLIVGGYTVVNPTALGLENMAVGRPIPGIIKITRHPVMWGVGLWALTHMLALGDGASLIFFGGLAGLALGGAWAIDRRRAREKDADWARLATQTSYWPFLALLEGRTRLSLSEIGWARLAGGLVLYGLMVVWHAYVLGVAPLPLPG